MGQMGITMAMLGGSELAISHRPQRLSYGVGRGIGAPGYAVAHMAKTFGADHSDQESATRPCKGHGARRIETPRSNLSALGP
jgi:hypothetical protein